jgi:hypothetical protein
VTYFHLYGSLEDNNNIKKRMTGAAWTNTGTVKRTVGNKCVEQNSTVKPEEEKSVIYVV